MSICQESVILYFPVIDFFNLMNGNAIKTIGRNITMLHIKLILTISTNKLTINHITSIPNLNINSLIKSIAISNVKSNLFSQGK